MNTGTTDGYIKSLEAEIGRLKEHVDAVDRLANETHSENERLRADRAKLLEILKEQKCTTWADDTTVEECLKSGNCGCAIGDYDTVNGPTPQSSGTGYMTEEEIKNAKSIINGPTGRD